MSMISLFPHLSEVKNSQDINIDTFFEQIKDGRWQDEILKLRNIPKEDEKAIKAYKETIPYVTGSGKFKHRSNEGIEKHSGFICMDIDHVENVLWVKKELCQDPLFYAVFLSCSGRGICAFAKINPKAHLESFYFLSEHLYQKYNINVDDKCKDVSRARLVSYDPDIYINENSQLCPVRPETKKLKPANINYVFADNDFSNIVNKIRSAKIDLTADYANWIKTGFALANKFGEGGRNYFHALSQFNEGYNFDKADRKFTHLLHTSNKDIGIGFIYHLAKQRNITVYSERTQTIIRTTHSVQKSKHPDKEEQAKKYLKELDGFSEDEVKEAEPIIKQVLETPVTVTNDNIILDIKLFLKQNYVLRKNVISRNIECDGVPIDDETINSIFIQCRTSIKSATKELVTSIIFSDFLVRYNPFTELLDFYIQNPPPEPTGHIKKLIESIDTDTPNADMFIRKWLVALIASLNYVHSPLLLVLCGPQNTGKTHFFRYLLPEALRKYYAESKLDLGKDDEILMTKKLIIMDDEMGGKSKVEQKKLKELTSKQVFTVREPYGRVSVDLQRLAMLCGTTNDEEILNDPTGNRRYLPVYVKTIYRDKYNAVNKDLLFYECWIEYNTGASYSLDDDNIVTLNESSDKFKQASFEEELVVKYFGLPEEHTDKTPVDKTNSEILSFIQMNAQVKLSQTKLGMVLKQMGFVQEIRKVNKITVRGYRVVELFAPMEEIKKTDHGKKFKDLTAAINAKDDDLPF
jgi:predicted P-loop ATPase